MTVTYYTGCEAEGTYNIVYSIEDNLVSILKRLEYTRRNTVVLRIIMMEVMLSSGSFESCCKAQKYSKSATRFTPSGTLRISVKNASPLTEKCTSCGSTAFFWSCSGLITSSVDNAGVRNSDGFEVTHFMSEPV